MTISSSEMADNGNCNSCLPFRTCIPGPSADATSGSLLGISPEMRGAEQIIAAELNGLSIEERVNALDDIHCVGNEIEETPEMIQKALEQFEEEIQKAKHPMYEMATESNRESYLTDPVYRLRFILVNLFDVPKAARQMLSFLQLQSRFFGRNSIGRGVTLSDLNEDDVRTFLSGMFHLQEQTDRSGRYVAYCFNRELLSGFTTDALVRLCFSVILHRSVRDSHPFDKHPIDEVNHVCILKVRCTPRCTQEGYCWCVH